MPSPVIIKPVSGPCIIGEPQDRKLLNASFLNTRLDVKDIVNYIENGIPKNVCLRYEFSIPLLNSDVFFRCNTNVVFASYNDKEGALWYKNEKKLLYYNPLIVEMLKQKDFFALWDYLEEQNG